MTDQLALDALERWSLGPARVSLAAARENTVYRVEAGTRKYALRVHRSDYRSENQLKSELDWMAALSRGGLHLPEPVAASDGSLITKVSGKNVDVLTWLDGHPMGENGELVATDNVAGGYQALGKSMADLHQLSDEWELPRDFSRPAWDIEGLVGQSPIWGRFWENPSLNDEQVSLFEKVRTGANVIAATQPGSLDYGLIHADLVPENVLLDNSDAYLIDFDDSGFGFRLFDLATTLNRARRTDRYEEYRDAFLASYLSRREIDLEPLPLFQALRALTYVGWVVERMDEPGAQERNRRFIREAEFWVGEWLRSE